MSTMGKNRIDNRNEAPCPPRRHFGRQDAFPNILMYRLTPAIKAFLTWTKAPHIGLNATSRKRDQRTSQSSTAVQRGSSTAAQF
jgi:hypothetical protein